jgi:hypothetical protein
MPALSAPNGVPATREQDACPTGLERDVASDGLRCRARPIRPDDGPQLVALHERLSARSSTAFDPAVGG